MKPKPQSYIPRHAAVGEENRRQQTAPVWDPELEEQIRRYQRERGRKKERRRRALLKALMAVLAAMFVLSLVMLGRSLRRDELKGVWMLDENTVYEFNGRGQGVLRLPLGTYGFSYIVRGNTLSVDFEDQTAEDAAYSYTCSGPDLALKSGTGAIYLLQKKK